MRLIDVSTPTYPGLFAKVDDQDFEAVSRFKWHATKRHNRFYAQAWIGGKKVLMHRYLLGTPRGLLTDHKDSDGLNNRRGNLRVASGFQNQWNRGATAYSASGYKGVFWDSFYERWKSEISFHGRKISLGTFPTPEAAALAYNEAAKKYHGEFAYFNEVAA